jgi:SecD/SecF fusion protein
MKKTITSVIAIVLVIALIAFIGFFGFEVGIINIPPVEEGITLGLDLVGGSEIVYEAEIPDGTSASDVSDGMETAQTMLRQRLNSLGYTEANVYLSGTTQLVVEIPNVDDPEEAVQMLGTTANIEFRDYLGNVILEGSDIASATASYGQLDESSASQYFVSLKLTEEGYSKFVSATAEIAGYSNDNNYLAIMMDDETISTPFVGEEYSGVGIDTDSPVITLGSNSTVDYAKYLAEIISAGQLPFALREAKVESVGATLGEKSLETSIIAGLIGIILIMIFMVAVYKIPGLVADFALLLYIALFLIVMSAAKVNLSLPGIAGIILTIGMAVDANVIIFERLREELNSGRTLRAAVDSGFKRAYTAIIDSNVTTIIAAVVLLWQGTGTILGFAKTLLIGVILSMICMLLIPNLLMKSIATMRIKNLSLFGAKKDPEKPSAFEKAAQKYSFVRNFKICRIISGVVCLIGLVGLVLQLFGVSALNMDLDFVGGVQMEVELGQTVTRDIQEDIASIYNDVAGVSASVTTSGNSGTAVTAKSVEISSEVRQAVFDEISEKYSDAELVSTDFVSASVGNDLKRAAFVASILAALLILVYITIRFEFRSGLVAIICLIHDLLFMLAFFVIFRIPVNMTFIAAALTIIGYSINATIVVFDRVRENYKKLGGGDFAAIVDKSVWETMRRSIGTTITTLLPVVFIIILGVTSIRIFAIPLTVGIIAGGYSSTCIAGPMWNLLKGSKQVKIR